MENSENIENAENLESMVFYATWYEAADDEGEEFRNKFVNQVLRYGLYKEIPDNSDNPIANAMFKLIKPLIDSNVEKRKNGRKGGRPKKNPAETSGLSNGNVNANVNGNDNANVNENVNEASATDSLEAVRSEPIKSVDVGKLKGRSKK